MYTCVLANTPVSSLLFLLPPQYQESWVDMRGVVDTMRASVSGQASLMSPSLSPNSSLTPHAMAADTPSPFV